MENIDRDVETLEPTAKEPAQIREKMVNYLNQLTTMDPTWMKKLMDARQPCNESVAYHPTLVAGYIDNVSHDPAQGYEAGFLGVINGFILSLPGLEKKPIFAQVNDDTKELEYFR